MREHQAHHDDLTGLPNRRQLGRLLPDVIGAAAERLEHVGLVLIDLDRFKDVNDTLGHAAGDRLLIDVATRLTHLLPLGSLVARLGGDEFAVVLPPAGSADGAMALCEQVANAFVDRFSVDGVELLVEASMGVVVAPGDGADLDTLLRRADVAMYEGKRGHVRLVRYDPALDPHSPDQLSVTAALQRGIETGELLMHFQPKIDIATGMVAGVEALVRWNRGGAELVPPDKFISQAEHSGLAGPLFTEVLNLSLAQARKWHNEGLVLGVAVNMSARNLADPDLAVVVGEALSRFRLPPGLVTLELTENAALANPVLAQQALARLLSLGVRIALDDFGTGHSSIRLLRDFPIQELKIDRSFVGAMHHDADAYAIVGNLTRLARDLRLGVVAEGVEDLVTHQALVDLGCDSAQGWYYARPADGESITAWLRDRTITDLHHRQHGPNLGCFYDLLAVPLRASLDEIDAAYSQSMRSAVTAGNLPLVARLRVAYETLTDPTLRASYDRTLVRRSKVA
jgi:diguanylate cyclase